MTTKCPRCGKLFYDKYTLDTHLKKKKNSCQIKKDLLTIKSEIQKKEYDKQITSLESIKTILESEEFIIKEKITQINYDISILKANRDIPDIKFNIINSQITKLYDPNIPNIEFFLNEKPLTDIIAGILVNNNITDASVEILKLIYCNPNHPENHSIFRCGIYIKIFQNNDWEYIKPDKISNNLIKNLKDALTKTYPNEINQKSGVNKNGCNVLTAISKLKYTNDDIFIKNIIDKFIKELPIAVESENPIFN